MTSTPYTYIKVIDGLVSETHESEHENLPAPFIKVDAPVSVGDAYVDGSLYLRPTQNSDLYYFDINSLSWLMTTENLNKVIDEALSLSRDDKLLVDVTINITGDREVILKNDERTKVNVHFKLTTLAADLSIPTMAYECRNGWFDLNYNDYQEIIWGLDSFTQSVFDALRRVYDTHETTPFTSVESALTAFEEELDV